MINQTQWDKIRQQVMDTPGVPEWAIVLCEKSMEQVWTQTKVAFESKIVDQSYITFLDEQIGLNARGSEWTALLKQRRTALCPFVGKTLAFLSVVDGGHVLWLRFDPNNSFVVSAEAYDERRESD